MGTTRVEAELSRRWSELAGPGNDRVGADLIARYTESHRRYHTAHHLAAMLTVIDDLAEHAPDPAAVRWAAWFHDAIYAVDRDDNEARSADLARAELTALGATPALIDEVDRLVRLTAGHDPAPGDGNGAVLCDADLAVLGAPEAGYRAYAAAVRHEYAHVPDELFRIGRASVLRGLGAAEHLFHTPAARARFEDAARRNLAAELVELAAPVE